jgi:Fe-S cluster assembly iron-binding protein IscA
MKKLGITSRAAKEVRRAAAANGAEGMALRVAAKQESDGSVTLGIGFDEERSNDDMIETAGVTLLVSKHSSPLLIDKLLDFVEIAPGEQGFVVIEAPQPEAGEPGADAAPE